MRKHAIAISAGEGQGELGEEQSIGRTDIEAPAIDGEGQITAPRRQKVQSGRKAERTIGLDHLLVTKDGEKLGPKDVHPEKTEIKTRAQTGD